MGRIQQESVCEQQITYSPLPSQQKFHESTARFKGFSGPVGSGKSQALCHEAIRLSYLNPGRTGLIGAPTYPMLRDATQSALLNALEVNDIPFDFHKSESTLTINDSNSRILLRSMEEYDRLRGTNLAWYGLDELTYTHEEAWTRLEARLRDPEATRLCGFAVWTPKGFDWVYRRFIENPTSNYEVTLAAPFENRFILDIVPDYYERLRTSYEEGFYMQEAMGSYVNARADLVYRAFSRDLNVAETEVDPRLPLLWSMDFNVSPMCSVVAQRRGNQLWVIDEFVVNQGATEQACREFLVRYGGHFAGIQVYGDASGYARKTTGVPDYTLVRDMMARTLGNRFSLNVGRQNPLVSDRVLMVNSKLKTAAGASSLFVSSRCRELILDLEQVSYRENSAEIDKDRDKRRTHLSDALGYLVWEQFRHREQIGEQRHRLF